jgi:hypothetical protein
MPYCVYGYSLRRIHQFIEKDQFSTELALVRYTTMYVSGGKLSFFFSFCVKFLAASESFQHSTRVYRASKLQTPESLFTLLVQEACGNFDKSPVNKIAIASVDSIL